MLESPFRHLPAGPPWKNDAPACLLRNGADTVVLSTEVAGVAVAWPGANPGVRGLPPRAPTSPVLCAPLANGAGGSGPGPTLCPPAQSPAAGGVTATQNILLNSGGSPPSGTSTAATTALVADPGDSSGGVTGGGEGQCLIILKLTK